MIAFGTRLYGNVDRLTERCHVATEFFHLQFIPLVPIRSLVVIEDEDGESRGVEIKLSWKSIFMAWARAVFVITMLVGIGYGIYTWTGRGLAHSDTLMSMAVGLGGLFLWRGSYTFSSISDERAAEMLTILGLEPDEAEKLLQEA